MSETYTMPPQYPEVAEALARPVDRIRRALSETHQLTGRPLDISNFESEWGAPLSRNVEKIAAGINRLGREVMAADCEPSFAYSKEVVADLDRALARIYGRPMNFSAAHGLRDWSRGGSWLPP